MPTRQSILTLVRCGLSYRQIARTLGLRPGPAAPLAPGSAADGGDEEGPAAEHREGALSGSTQHLADPPVFVPQTDEAVDAWIRGRVMADPALRKVWAAHPAAPPALADGADI